MTPKDQAKKPSTETLQTQLRIKWDDHFQTRRQTWDMFQYQLVFLGVVIGVDQKLNTDKPDIVFFILLGILMLVISYLGLRVSIYHRGVQHDIFSTISVLEEAL